MVRIATALMLCACALLSGCGLMQATQKFSSSVANAATPNSRDSYHDSNPEVKQDKKQEMIMQQARGSSGMAKSSEPDKWYSDLLYDERSKSIERSLGVEYY